MNGTKNASKGQKPRESLELEREMITSATSKQAHHVDRGEFGCFTCSLLLWYFVGPEVSSIDVAADAHTDIPHNSLSNLETFARCT